MTAEERLKRLILLLLALCLLFTCTLGLFSCAPAPGGDGDGDGDGGDGDGGTKPPPIDNSTAIITPDYKDYGRGTVNLSELVYARPELPTLTADILALTEDVSGAMVGYSTLLSELTDLLCRLEEAQMMLSLAKISAARDTSLAFWQDEQSYFAENMTELNLASRALLGACADSEYRAALESGLFGYSLDAYIGYVTPGEVLTLLYKQEAEYMFKYESLSPDTVEITNGEATGTLTELLRAYAEEYGEDSDRYFSYKAVCTVLYNSALEAERRTIFTELVKIRQRIADEQGYASYTELAYAQAGYDYTDAQMSALLERAKTAIGSLESLMGGLYSALSGTNIQKQDYEVTVNDMYSIYSAMGAELGDAFAYMLQHGLYDIKEGSDIRAAEGFSEYIGANASPVIFATVSDNVSDYARISTLFGSFLDGYVNYGFTDSASLSHLYSLSSELLCATRLRTKLSASSFKYVKNLTAYNLLYDLCTAIRCAAFEYEVYSLSYDEITEERLDGLAAELGTEIYGAYSSPLTLSDVISERSFSAPMTNEAYITATLGAAQLLSLELAEEGSGSEIFAALLERDTDAYQGELSEAGLDSPFGADVFTELVFTLGSFASGVSGN